MSEVTLIDVLRVEMQAWGEKLTLMTEAVTEMRHDLKKLGVLEERHAAHSASLDRAFKSIAELEAEHVSHLNDAQAKRGQYDKALWTATGFIFAVSVGWTMLGVFMISTVQDVLKTTSQMQIHIKTDEVTRMEDVREIHKKEFEK